MDCAPNVIAAAPAPRQAGRPWDGLRGQFHCLLSTNDGGLVDCEWRQAIGISKSENCPLFAWPSRATGTLAASGLPLCSPSQSIRYDITRVETCPRFGFRIGQLVFLQKFFLLSLKFFFGENLISTEFVEFLELQIEVTAGTGSRSRFSWLQGGFV